MNLYKKYNILGIPFIDGVYNYAINILNKGGLMVVPAAPALATISENKKYHDALINSDFAIPDSGYMVLLLRIFKRIYLNKLSGYAFLKEFFKEKSLSEKKCLFLIDPTENDITINNNFLHKQNILIDLDYHYCAPIYDKNWIEDPIALKLIEEKKPKYIMINLGGGVQERLGYYLKNHLSYSPGIICTGAAIAFFTGQQVVLSAWIDRFYLGWLWRIIQNPIIFLPRYLKGVKLFVMLLKKGSVK